MDDRVELPDQRHATRDVGAPELLRQGRFMAQSAGLDLFASKPEQ